MLLSRTAPLLALLLAGCPPEEDPRPDAGPKLCSGFVGDRALPPEIQLVVREVDATVTVLTDGARVPMLLPPQGGKVIFLGVRARNLDTCGPQLIASLRDECTNRIVGLEGRPVYLLDEDGDGWATPGNPIQIDNFGNVPVCPNAASSRDLYDESYLAEANLTDTSGRVASASIHVIPTCAQPEFEAECHCTCRAGYNLGDTCIGIPDAGLPSGTCPPADAGP